nr:MAG TPA_asm: hypothetical protein [Caudoviricetes sp.]
MRVLWRNHQPLGSWIHGHSRPGCPSIAKRSSSS